MRFSFLCFAFAFAVFFLAFLDSAMGSEESLIKSPIGETDFAGFVSMESDGDSSSDSSDSDSELSASVEGLLSSWEGVEADDSSLDFLASMAALSCARAFSFACLSARSMSYWSLPAWASQYT